MVEVTITRKEFNAFNDGENVTLYKKVDFPVVPRIGEHILLKGYYGPVQDITVSEDEVRISLGKFYTSRMSLEESAESWKKSGWKILKRDY